MAVFGSITNLAIITLTGYVFYETGSAWSFTLLLLFLFSASNDRKDE